LLAGAVKHEEKIMRLFWTGALLVTVNLLGGCSLPTHVLPADEAAASKIKSELKAGRSFIVNERFLILPVSWDDSEGQQSVFSVGPLAIKPSAWSQSAWVLSSDFAQISSSVLNLIVVDLDSGGRQRVFDHHVAAWVHPFTFKPQADGDAGQQASVPRYPGLLILIARTQDTNADKQIDHRDSEWLFVYDVRGGKLKRISPQGYRVEHMRLLVDTLLVFMAPESAPLGNTSTLAIYKYDPRTDKGELIKDIR
jgi:hypothetical protein